MPKRQEAHVFRELATCFSDRRFRVGYPACGAMLSRDAGTIVLPQKKKQLQAVPGRECNPGTKNCGPDIYRSFTPDCLRATWDEHPALRAQRRKQ